MNQTLRHQLSDTFDLALGLEVITLLSHDHREAIDALLEKLEPNFRGI